MLNTNLSIMVTARCTLNCRYCALGIPFLHEKEWIPAARLYGQIESLLSLYEKNNVYLNHLDLLGGEPLLYPELPELVRSLTDLSGRFHELRILTNSTLLPSDALLDALDAFREKAPLLLILADYGKLSRQLGELSKLLDFRGIRYRVDNYAGENQYYDGWVTYGEAGCLWGTAELRYRECAFRHSGTLEVYDGKAYPCTRALAVGLSGRTALREEEWLDITASPPERSVKKYRALLVREQPLSICAHCSGLGPHAQRIPAAQQTPRKNECE